MKKRLLSILLAALMLLTLLPTVAMATEKLPHGHSYRRKSTRLHPVRPLN